MTSKSAGQSFTLKRRDQTNFKLSKSFCVSAQKTPGEAQKISKQLITHVLNFTARSMVSEFLRIGNCYFARISLAIAFLCELNCCSFSIPYRASKPF